MACLFLQLRLWQRFSCLGLRPFSHFLWVLFGIARFAQLQTFAPAASSLFLTLVPSFSRALSSGFPVCFPLSSFQRRLFFLLLLRSYLSGVTASALLAVPAVGSAFLFAEAYVSSVVGLSVLFFSAVTAVSGGCYPLSTFYNHTFPKYLISTILQPRRMYRHTHRPRKRKIAPKLPLLLSPVVRLITPPCYPLRIHGSTASNPFNSNFGEPDVRRLARCFCFILNFMF